MMKKETAPAEKNDTASTDKLPSRRSWLTIVLALALVILVFISGRMSHRIKSTLPTYTPPASDSASIQPDYATEIRRYNDAVSAALDRHLAELDKIAGAFEKQLQTEIPGRFDKARDTIPGIRKSFAVFDTMGAVVWDGVLDKIKGSERLQDRCNAMLEPFMTPCTRAVQSLIADYETFEARMNAENAAFREELASAHGKLPDAVRVEFPMDTLRTKMAQTYEALRGMPLKAGFVAAEVAIEAACIKSTMTAGRSLILRHAGKTIAKGTASAAAPAADGALPIGDIFAVLGAAWTVYDIYDLVNVLPNEIEKSLNATVDSLQAQTIDEVSKAIRQTRTAHVQAARSIATAAWAAQDDLQSPAQ
ncbi:MAG: hypothetical protein ACI4QT_07415 [Kiritimatiellia bacterium]